MLTTAAPNVMWGTHDPSVTVGAAFFVAVDH